MDNPVLLFFIVYLATSFVGLGLGAMMRGGNGVSRVAEFFYWTLPSQLAIRIARGFVAAVGAFFAAITR